MKKLLLTLAVLIMCALPVAVFGASDNEAPIVTSVALDKTTVSAGESLNVTLDCIEEGTGTTYITLTFIDDEYHFFHLDFFPEGGEKHTGTHTFTCNIPNDVVGSTYHIEGIYVQDDIGNYKSYYDPNVISGITLTVISDYQEMTASDYEVSSIELLDNEVERDGKLRVRLKVLYKSELLTESDPLPEISIGIANDSYGGAFSLENAQLSSGYITGEIKVPGSAFRSGTAMVNSVFISMFQYCAAGDDLRGLYEDSNGFYLLREYDGKKCYLLGSNNFQVFDVPGVDYSYPKMKTFSLENDSVAKPGMVRVRVNAVDDVGITNIHVILERYNSEDDGRSFAISDSRETGNVKEFDGYIDVPISMQNIDGSYFISNISISDTSGNISSYWATEFSKDDKGWFYACNAGPDLSYYYVDTLPSVEVHEEFDIDFETSMTNTNLKSKLENMEEGKTARVLINSSSIAKAEIFKAIQGEDKTVIFYFDNYQWVFNGKDITDPKDVDLSIRFEQISGDVYGSVDPLMKIIFPDNGVLPGKANIRIKSDYTYNQYRLTGSMYLYYQNDENTLYIENNGNPQYILDDTNHWCYFDLTHNSSFVLSGRNLGKEVTAIKTGKVLLRSGATFTDSKTGNKYKIVTKGKTVALSRAGKNIKAVVVPATVSYKGVNYKVTQVNANAFMKKNIRTVTIGKNVKIIRKYAFKGSKATKVILKTKLLKKAYVKGCLKGSNIKIVQVKVSSRKSLNKTYVKQYKNYFTKKNAGKKATVSF